VTFTYGVVGAGRQGTAAAYDMARFGDAALVKIADADPEAARRAADRVNGLIGRAIAAPFVVDATDRTGLRGFLDDVDSFLSAVPYWHNPGVLEAAIDARASMTDLGGNTDIVRGQLAQSLRAEAAGIAAIPDCGQVPGMGTSLSVYAMSLLDEVDEVTFWDGGNPLHPEPPFNYILTFNIAGLTNEYYGVAHFIVDGRRVEVPTFREEDYELVDLPEPIGRMEARPRWPGRSRAGCAPSGTRPCAGPAISPSGRPSWMPGFSRPIRSTSTGCRLSRATCSTPCSIQGFAPSKASRIS
jgi:lysine 6-dehydrogenase